MEEQDKYNGGTPVQTVLPPDVMDEIVIRRQLIPKNKRPVQQTYLRYLIIAGLKATAGKEWK